MTTRLITATLMVLTLAGCRDESPREDVGAAEEELLNNAATVEELEAELLEIAGLPVTPPAPQQLPDDFEGRRDHFQLFTGCAAGDFAWLQV